MKKSSKKLKSMPITSTKTYIENDNISFGESARGHRSPSQQLLAFLERKRINQSEGYKRLKQLGHTVSDWRLNPDISTIGDK
jgi:hypothetical protein